MMMMLFINSFKCKSAFSYGRPTQPLLSFCSLLWCCLRQRGWYSSGGECGAVHVLSSRGRAALHVGALLPGVISDAQSLRRHAVTGIAVFITAAHWSYHCVLRASCWHSSVYLTSFH